MWQLLHPTLCNLEVHRAEIEASAGPPSGYCFLAFPVKVNYLNTP